MRRRSRRRTKLFRSFRDFDLKKTINNYLYIFLWSFVILIFYSIINYNFFNSSEESNVEQYNLEQKDFYERFDKRAVRTELE